MPTDTVKLLAIISVLNVPGNASKSLCTACELHKQSRSAALRRSLDREAALAAAPAARPLSCHSRKILGMSSMRWSGRWEL